jgi:hypothetical protein
MENNKGKKHWKQRFFHEFTEYWINVAYMAIFFSAVIFYRRLVLAEHGIFLNDYFLGVIKALVIAKVVMIGAFIRISRKFEHKPLWIPVIYKAVLFTFWVMLFDVVEVYISGFINTPVFSLAFEELKGHVSRVWLGGALLIFFIFIPFFAFKELVRVMGKEKVTRLFFGSRGTDDHEENK